MLTFFSFRAWFTLSTCLFFAISAISLQAQHLPATVVPSNYKLLLDPDIAAQKFSAPMLGTMPAQSVRFQSYKQKQ